MIINGSTLNPWLVRPFHQYKMSLLDEQEARNFQPLEHIVKYCINMWGHQHTNCCLILACLHKVSFWFVVSIDICHIGKEVKVESVEVDRLCYHVQVESFKKSIRPKLFILKNKKSWHFVLHSKYDGYLHSIACDSLYASIC